MYKCSLILRFLQENSNLEFGQNEIKNEQQKIEFGQGEIEDETFNEQVEISMGPEVIETEPEVQKSEPEPTSNSEPENSMSDYFKLKTSNLGNSPGDFDFSAKLNFSRPNFGLEELNSPKPKPVSMVTPQEILAKTIELSESKNHDLTRTEIEELHKITQMIIKSDPGCDVAFYAEKVLKILLEKQLGELENTINVTQFLPSFLEETSQICEQNRKIQNRHSSPKKPKVPKPRVPLGNITNFVQKLDYQEISEKSQFFEVKNSSPVSEISKNLRDSAIPEIEENRLSKLSVISQKCDEILQKTKNLQEESQKCDETQISEKSSQNRESAYSRLSQNYDETQISENFQKSSQSSENNPRISQKCDETQISENSLRLPQNRESVISRISQNTDLSVIAEESQNCEEVQFSEYSQMPSKSSQNRESTESRFTRLSVMSSQNSNLSSQIIRFCDKNLNCDEKSQNPRFPIEASKLNMTWILFDSKPQEHVVTLLNKLRTPIKITLSIQDDLNDEFTFSKTPIENIEVGKSG